MSQRYSTETSGESLARKSKGSRDLAPFRRKVDMADKIALLEPSANPLTVILNRMGKNVTKDFRFQWMDDKLATKWGKIDETSVVSSQNKGDTTTIKVADQSAFSPGYTIKFMSSGEVGYITELSGNDSIVVRRGIEQESSGSVDDLPADDDILILFNTSEQGAGKPALLHTQPSLHWNYTEIIRTALGITGTLKAMDMHGGNDKTYREMKKGIEHAVAIERKMWFGERGYETNSTTGEPTTWTRGIFSWLENGGANTLQVTDGYLDPYIFNDWLISEAFRYGNKQRKIGFCGPTFMATIQNWGIYQLQTTTSEKTWGMAITNVLTPMGSFPLINHPEFDGSYAGAFVCLEVDELAYRYLKGRDTQLHRNRHSPDVDGEVDEYLTEFGLEFKAPLKHSMVTGIETSIPPEPA